jgi:glycosyltransferase involved in cell wall biosynthesis
MNFSICLIAKNEEHTLPRMIASLKEYQERGGEILVLDTGSTDKTAQIARDLGCKVEEVGEKFITIIDEELCKKLNDHFVAEGEKPIVVVGDKLFDYAGARNYIADFATNDMIATPDCDEIYTKFDLDKIQEAIANGVEQLEYNFVFSHDQFGNEVIKFMHSKFYNRKKLKWVGVVHEVLSGSARRQFFDESIIKLEHYQNEKSNRTGYIRGLALDCYLNPNNDRNSHYLGRELLWTGRPKSAISELTRHIDMNRWQTERAQSMIYVGEAYRVLGDKKKAIAFWNDSFQLEPNRRESIIRLASYFFQEGNAQKVACYCAMALEIPEMGFYANDLSHYTNYPHELMYWAKWTLGDREGSRWHWQKAFDYQPHNGKYLFDSRWYEDLPKVSIVIPNLGRPEGLQRCLDSIKTLNYPDWLIETIVIEDEPRLGVPARLKEGVEKATGSWIVYAANDMEFTPNCLIEAYFTNKKTGKRLVAFNAGPLLPDEGNKCEHFMIEKSLIPLLDKGEVFSTDFWHVGCDNWLSAQADKLNEFVRSEDAKIIHYHFSKGANFDTTYQIAWKEEMVAKDREILKNKLAQL